MEPSSRTQRSVAWLLQAPAVPRLLTAFYLVCAAIFVRTGYSLNDEGLTTYIWACWLRLDPLPMLFYQKAKPILPLLYALPSTFGSQAMLLVHGALCALAVPLAAAVARALGSTIPNLAAILVCMSPLFIAGGPGGLSNADGVLGILLFLYLLTVRRNDALAGLVLGLLPWVRHELGLFFVVFLVHAALVARRRTLVLTALAFPVAYGLAGVVYNHDVLWMLHFPPAASQPMAGNPVWEPVTAEALLANLIGLSPAFALAFAVPWRRLAAVERTLLVYLIAWLGLVILLPTAGIANFAFSSRYLLVLLPAVALLVARTVEQWRQGVPARLADLAVVALMTAVFLLSRVAHADAALPVLLASGWAVAAAIRGRPQQMTGLVLALTCVGPLLPNRSFTLPSMAPFVPEIAERLHDLPAAKRLPVYTNIHILSAYLNGPGAQPDVDVRFFLSADQRYEIAGLTNPANGQQAAVMRLPEQVFYGRAVFPDATLLGHIPDGALFALKDDRRLPLTLPPAQWDRHLVTVHTGKYFRLMRFVARPDQAGAPARP